MTKSNEQLVIEYRNGDASALSDLCEKNRGLVANISRGFSGNTEDLFQSGMIGIIEAANKFNPDNGAKFTTYASYWIFSYCVSCAREMNGTVTVTGRDGRRVLSLISRAKASLLNELGREPSIGEIAQSMDIDQKIVSAVIGVSSKSLDSPLDADGSLLSDVIPDAAPNPSQVAQLSSLQRAVHGFADTLTDENEKFIFNNVLAGDMTNQQAGDHFGVSRQRINQIVVKLRPLFKEYALSIGLDKA